MQETEQASEQQAGRREQTRSMCGSEVSFLTPPIFFDLASIELQLCYLKFRCLFLLWSLRLLQLCAASSEDGLISALIATPPLVCAICAFLNSCPKIGESLFMICRSIGRLQRYINTFAL